MKLDEDALFMSVLIVIMGTMLALLLLLLGVAVWVALTQGESGPLVSFAIVGAIITFGALAVRLVYVRFRRDA